jgi:imidazole glycerol-phosphate synthase subunit HisH
MTGPQSAPRVAIVDFGLGNLFSVAQACQAVGLQSAITPDRRVIERADAVILPGVGAFGDAMQTLRRQDLVGVLRDTPARGVPLIGICLGVQLLMTESHEFGRHRGLGLIEGEVVPLNNPREGERRLKVPQVGWNRIHATGGIAGWSGTPLDGLPDDTFMYFVHSFVVVPEDRSVVRSTTTYGDIEFCSSVSRGRIFACQFHPERSGSRGLRVYESLRKLVAVAVEERRTSA